MQLTFILAKLRQLTAANSEHANAANSKETTDDVDNKIIPHPGGSAGDGYTLQVNMCLTYDKAFYNAIRVRTTSSTPNRTLTFRSALFVN
jgi:hypothetical protein